MKVVIQRVREASVSIRGAVHSRIGQGLVLLVGIEDRDGEEDIEFLTSKVSN
ncbi:D-aminoacyl-tRNA deacylase, partial [Porphyromonas loveana]|uniref:D-aminoacyl-tRNA deacylase n=1 Tax=Porphyromonas loveana TaxID=1884669 RepID=UPI0035A1147A